MSWYRTYRPRTVSQLHSKAVREALSAMLKSGSIPQALLFAGPKGTGKTSSARIIARVLNCSTNAQHKPGTAYHEPCLKCERCVGIEKGSLLSVIEIDGASNRRIDDIRQLQEQFYQPAIDGEKKVYIIDEVHMLTREAFNALLKILEEPPEHVVFVFATTEQHKVPDTIQSRCTFIQFRQATSQELMTALQQIASAEQVSFEAGTLELIAQAANGSFRDAVKIFEQVCVDDVPLTQEVVRQQVQSVSRQQIQQLVQLILSKDEGAVAGWFKLQRESGVDAGVVHRELLAYLHGQLLHILGVETGSSQLTQPVVLFLLKQFSAVEIPLTHPMPLLPLEIAALEMVLKSKANQKGSSTPPVVEKPANSQRVDRRARQLPEGGQAGKVQGSDQSQSSSTSQRQSSGHLEEGRERSDSKDIKVAAQSFKAATLQLDTVPTVSAATASQTQAVSSGDGALIGPKWREFLSILNQKNMSIEAIMRSAQFVRGEQGSVVIEVFYPFHKDQLELTRYRQLVEEAVSQIAMGVVRCEFILSDKAVIRSSLHGQDVSNLTQPKHDEFVGMLEDALVGTVDS